MAYRIGYVYRITKIDDPTITYIGSTIQTIQRRWNRHKCSTSCSIGKLLNKNGCDNFKIVLIQKYLVCDKIHLRAYEQLWINKYKLKKCCINERDALPLLKKEKINKKNKKWRLEHQEEIKEYRQDHKEQQKEYYNKYRQDHKEQIKEQGKQYRLEHREQKKEYLKEYYQDHKEQLKAKRSEKITCECGCIIARGDISKHKKTTKHISLMSSN